LQTRSEVNNGCKNFPRLEKSKSRANKSFTLLDP